MTVTACFSTLQFTTYRYQCTAHNSLNTACLCTVQRNYKWFSFIPGTQAYLRHSNQLKTTYRCSKKAAQRRLRMMTNPAKPGFVKARTLRGFTAQVNCACPSRRSVAKVPLSTLSAAQRRLHVYFSWCYSNGPSQCCIPLDRWYTVPERCFCNTGNAWVLRLPERQYTSHGPLP